MVIAANRDFGKLSELPTFRVSKGRFLVGGSRSNGVFPALSGILTQFCCGSFFAVLFHKYEKQIVGGQ